MKRYSTRNESPHPFEDLADPEALPLPRGPDSPTFRLVLNSGEPYLGRVAELVRRLWIKQRPREDAEAVLAQVLEDLAERRYALRHLAAYVSALPLVASPCHGLAGMIADYYGLNDRTKRSRAAGSLARRASPALSDPNGTESRGGSPDPPRQNPRLRLCDTGSRGGSGDPPRKTLTVAPSY